MAAFKVIHKFDCAIFYDSILGLLPTKVVQEWDP